MQLVMEGLDYFIGMSIEIMVFLILIVLLCSVIMFLYRRFYHFGKKIRFNIDTSGNSNMPGPAEWDRQMFELSSGHGNVKTRRYNFVLDDYNNIIYRKLNRIRDNISEISVDIITLIPAARWLFDNFQMMYREIKKARSSGTSYEMLPILKCKEYRGFPRVYVVAKKMVALSGGHLNEENISVMLKAYQKEIPLTDKELWVLPELLGFCLLESIVEVAEDIIHIISVKSKADSFVRENLGGGQGNTDINDLLKETDSDCRMNFSFHAHVIYLLKNMPVDTASIQKYIDYHFRSAGKQLNPSAMFMEEGKIESYLETNIRALIISLREMNEMDTEKFFEEYSYLEQTLNKDPDGIYTKMDSDSRGMYREVIVNLSLKYGIDEVKIVNDCLELAAEGREDLHCSHHVGAYLLGKGYPVLKAKVRNRKKAGSIKTGRNVKGFLYFFTCLVILFGISFVLYQFSSISGKNRFIAIFILAFPLLLGIALEITNFIFTRRIKVTKIPSLDYLAGIPDEARTFVVMPVIVSAKGQALEYLDRLQKHYLANRQPNLYFAVLIDYEDSPNQFMQKDEVIENALTCRLNELNAFYPSEHQRFSLFVRYRKWNESEKCFMGWERKRGKLEEFNSLLNGTAAEETSFSKISCDRELLHTFRYVITLDADTNLIRDNAVKLVGLLDHPMNKPVLDEAGRKVQEGYVIIQPSVRNHIVDRKGSRFAEIFGGQSGLAHYGAVISDIYQDIFSRAIFTGKGIYDIKAFHTLLHGTIPENRVLSHDLIESCYARTAFSSNAKVMDNFPNSVVSYAKREHRWIRGDWQLLPWLFAGRAAGRREICLLSRWKIFDNLRRSIVPVSKTLFIIYNLAFLSNVCYLWIPFVFFSDIFNLLVLLYAIISQKIFRPKLALVYKGLFKELGLMVQRAFLELVITPYRAYLAADAIIRTLYRLLISKKNLLRWNTAESVDSSVVNTEKGYFLTMWSSMVPAAILFILLMIKSIGYSGILLYTAVILSWTAAFHIAYQVSRPKEEAFKKEPAEDRELLLDAARRTWQFFKDFTTKENNWLCPDNYQISRVRKISAKTSPTNIGLQFLSILSARDFGFETLSTAVGLIENLMETVQKLAKWNGHLYNWYSTKTLEVLNPSYVSTVDSGNFLGHLIALKNGLLEQLETPVFPECLLSEFRNILKLSCYDGKLKDSYPTIGDFIGEIADIWEDLNGREAKPYENPRWSRELANGIEKIVNEAAGFKLKESSFSEYPTLKELADRDNKKAKLLIEKIDAICNKIDRIVENMDFTFLYNDKRMLFHIGYHVSSQMLDNGCYDLMASESSLTSFMTIARGEVPLRHWYKLGRPLTMVNGIPCFVSWSGTMFEYLMPNLVLREYEGSVYAETARAAVLQHINYAREAGIPWGISESQYFRFDLNSNYQYKAFGVPKLRLQPVRKNSMVVTPYATMLALDYAGRECFSNLRRLMELGVYGEYGFYEAIDYNSPDSVEMTPYCIVKSFMTHHQGMSLAAMNNYLNGGILRKRFHMEPMVKATEVLLEEKRVSQLISIAKKGYTIKIGKVHYRDSSYSNRYVNGAAPRIPAVNYLSNNKYSLMVTSDGDGFSSYGNMMLYRWRADPYAGTGNYIYIKDNTDGRIWSTSYHPTRTEPDEYQVIFAPHQSEFKRKDGEVSTHTVVSLSPDHDIEIRKVTLTNHGDKTRTFELTSYLEIVCDSHLAELSHPAFNKLFIESEFLEKHSIFLSKRRSSKKNTDRYLCHMVKTGAKLQKKAEYENDRLRFLGRNNTTENPDMVVNSIPLSNKAGFCNDPIMSLRVSISLEAGESGSISFITGICHSKEEAEKIGEELELAYRIDDIIEKFRLQTIIELKYLEITRPQLKAFQDLISPIFYPTGYYRGPEENIRRNFKNQSSLWKFGVSGDNPILLLKIKSIEDSEIIKDVLKAYEYLRINQVMVDLIILSEAKHGYMQGLDDFINDLTSTLRIYDADSERPSLFLLHAYQMIPAEIDLLYTAARVVFSEKTGIYFKNLKENLNELIEE